MSQLPLSIATNQDLSALCSQLVHKGDDGAFAIALDTEFWREQTYWPVLCLVQLATNDQVYLIDALACDLEPLRQVLIHPKVTKILHASDQDCEIFLHQLGILPEPLFDTQIAARVLGFQRQIGYAALVKELLGIDIDKSNQHTNWRKRPLSQAQQSYAAQDVVHLGHIYELLLSRLQEDSAHDHAFHEGLTHMREALHRAQDPAQIWKRWDNPRFQEATRARLQFLACYRETLAQSLNVPRSFIFKDEALMSFINNPPRSLRQLDRTRGLGKHFPNKSAFLESLKPYGG